MHRAASASRGLCRPRSAEQGFRDANLEWERHTGGGHGTDADYFNRLVGRHPAGAEAFVESSCAGAVVAAACGEVFDAPLLRRRVPRRAKEAAESQIVGLLTQAEDNDGTTGSIN